MSVIYSALHIMHKCAFVFISVQLEVKIINVIIYLAHTHTQTPDHYFLLYMCKLLIFYFVEKYTYLDSII